MEDVILEYIDSEDMDKVAVLPYDRLSKEICGQVIEVTKRPIAEKEYNVMGYLIDGEISSNEEDDEEPDYYEMYGYEDDDD